LSPAAKSRGEGRSRVSKKTTPVRRKKKGNQTRTPKNGVLKGGRKGEDHLTRGGRRGVERGFLKKKKRLVLGDRLSVQHNQRVTARSIAREKRGVGVDWGGTTRGKRENSRKEKGGGTNHQPWTG